ncbi:altered inheritance of mitochondria protein 9 [Anaeramoeba flamelloides]|uniref:Altered inheritance of mitochondria protein 9 n=1 Tax=Anaeramoeba flamelloides TaxID=1746091 RepID=A0AAV7ZP89_9EUKA|nr:altered inheritance of mitochondria protein 9 [Anaeramoeba flamelloides]
MSDKPTVTLTNEKVQLLFDTISVFEDKKIIKKIKRYNKGCINSVWQVDCENNDQYVLKVITPLKKWKGIKTLNEATSYEYAKAKTTCKLPNIYSYDATTNNALSQEYILMEKVQGTILESVWNKISNEKRKIVIDQIALLVSQLQEEEFTQMGSIRQESKEKFVIDRFVDTGKGPYNNSSEFYYDLFTEKKKLFQKDERLESFAGAFENFYDLYFSKLEPFTKFRFGHHDLNLQNIFVDPANNYKITGVIDWEWSCPFIPDSIFMEDDLWCDLEGSDQEIIKDYFHNQLLKLGISKSPLWNDYQILNTFDDMSMGLTSYNWWFDDKIKGEKFFQEKFKQFIIFIKEHNFINKIENK